MPKYNVLVRTAVARDYQMVVEAASEEAIDEAIAGDGESLFATLDSLVKADKAKAVGQDWYEIRVLPDELDLRGLGMSKRIVT